MESQIANGSTGTPWFLNRELAETIAHWATTLAIVAVVVGGLWAYVKYRLDRKQHKWDAARALFGSFIDIAIENPEFYPGSWTARAQNDPVERNRYRWLVARFLWAAEDIVLNIRPGDVEERRVWTTAIKVSVREHADFFFSHEGEIERSCYHDPLTRLIDEALQDEVSGVDPPMCPSLPVDTTRVHSEEP